MPTCGPLPWVMTSSCFLGEVGERLDDAAHVGHLGVRVQALAPAQQRVAAERDDDPHSVSLRQMPSRSSGQLMQRGPPRPRPSSLPGMVMTSMPLSRRKLLVVVLRS